MAKLTRNIDQDLQFQIVDALSREFTNVFLIDTKTATSRAIKLQNKIANWLDIGEQIAHPYYETVSAYMNLRVHPDDRERMLNAVRLEVILKELADKSEYSGTYRIVDGDTIHFFRFVFIRIDGTDTIIEGYQNIDALVQREKERSDDLQGMLDVVNSLAQSFDGVYLVHLYDMEYETIWSRHRSYSEHVPYSGKTAPVLERMLNEAVREDYRDAVREFIDLSTVQKRLYGKRSITIQFIARNGRWLEGIFVPTNHTYDSENANILWAVKEIQEQKLEEERQRQLLINAVETAQKANYAKTAFLNNMSHDIRTPLNAIIGYTALARTHLDDPQTVSDFLDKVEISGNHLLSLINDVLDMSRIESGKTKLEEDEVHLPELISDIWTIIEANVTAKNLQLYVDSESIQTEYVITDKLRLNQVLINILGNAIKFTPYGGTIEFSIRELACKMYGYATYEFRIKDTGIGMSKEFQEHIFEAFSREKTSTVSGIRGTGLGMAITKNIVDFMDGTIDVQSEEGVGTEFVVVLSFKKFDVKEKEDALIQKTDKLDFTNKSVLIVEDNELNQEIAEIILKEAGFETELAEDGTIAVERIKKSQQGRYDLILMDIQMPLLDGYEATKQIRMLDGWSEVPIIAMTANAFDEDKRKAFAAGMNGFVTKPVKIPELMKLLGEVMTTSTEER